MRVRNLVHRGQLIPLLGRYLQFRHRCFAWFEGDAMIATLPVALITPREIERLCAEELRVLPGGMRDWRR